MEKMMVVMRHNRKRILMMVFALACALSCICMAGAAESEDTNIQTSPVIATIQTTATQLRSDASVVIASGVGIGVVFWGSKVLWSKFRSMAR